MLPCQIRAYTQIVVLESFVAPEEEQRLIIIMLSSWKSQAMLPLLRTQMIPEPTGNKAENFWALPFLGHCLGKGVWLSKMVQMIFLSGYLNNKCPFQCSSHLLAKMISPSNTPLYTITHTFLWAPAMLQLVVLSHLAHYIKIWHEPLLHTRLWCSPGQEACLIHHICPEHSK